MLVTGGPAFKNIILAAIIVSALYLAREVVVPVVLAVFLTFVLTPLVGLMQRHHFPRSLAVLSSVTVAFAIVFALSMMVLSQLRQLTDDLPGYQTTLSEKVGDLRETMVGSGLVVKGSHMLKDMTKALDTNPVATTPLAERGNAAKPVPVEVHQPEPGASDTLVAVLGPLVSPITTTAIIVIFVIFFLFQREDLRNRFIRLAGTRDIERTTTALDDAGQKLARYFLTQLLLNSVFGIVIGASLTFIGIPNAALWGLLAAILRFVPYLGAPLAAILPITLAAAIEPGWHTVLWTAAMFLVVETLTGQVVEPLVYGHSAGLSPVAIVIAAAFWAWLWGPLGLLISTPITLCLVVMARHVEGLDFVDVMLGDQPALSPQEATYQRMLAGDSVEAIEHAQLCLKEMPVRKYYEQILLGALALAQQDAERRRLDEKRLENIRQTVTEMIDDFREREDHRDGTMPSEKGAADEADANVVRPVSVDSGVACAPGFGKLDQIAAVVVAEALQCEGIAARAITAEDIAAYSGVTCICFLEHLSEVRMRYTLRRLFKNEPKQVTILALSKADTQLKEPKEAVPDRRYQMAFSLTEAIGLLAKSPPTEKLSPVAERIPDPVRA